MRLIVVWLFVFGLLIDHAAANPMMTSLKKEPKAFAQTVVRLKAAESAFFQCWGEITIADRIEAPICNYALQRLNVLARALDMEIIEPDDTETFRIVLGAIVDELGEQ